VLFKKHNWGEMKDDERGGHVARFAEVRNTVIILIENPEGG
jgi:hypothetical protein